MQRRLLCRASRNPSNPPTNYRPHPQRSTSRFPSARATRAAPPPILVRQVRNGLVEAVHRGDVVEVDAAGRMLHVIGDPDRLVNLRSAVKPFGLLALLRGGGLQA